jgi:MarR family transcriptional regulator, negative regulator of the multidrug operon emrRAB
MRRAEGAAVSKRNVANLLGALATLIADRVAEAVAQDAAELPKRTALAVLAKYPGCSIEELRVSLDLSHSGCVRLVDRLADTGLVTRKASSDGRAVALHLTRSGRKATSETVECREQVLQEMLGVLSEEERKQLAGIALTLLDRSVLVPQAAMRTCRLCDYDACVRCPMHKFLVEEEPAS